MKRALIAGLLLAGTLALTGCASKQIDFVQPEQTAQIQTAPLRIEVVGGKEQSLLPGIVLEGAPAINNAGAMDVYCFLKVEMPVFPAEKVSLELDELASDPVPLIQTSVSDAWSLVTESEEDSIRTSVYAYGEPERLKPEETTSELFTEWRVTNFRVRGGMCGDYGYDELMAQADRIRINGYAIQADHVGSEPTPELLWQLITGNGGL